MRNMNWHVPVRSSLDKVYYFNGNVFMSIWEYHGIYIFLSFAKRSYMSNNLNYMK